MPKKLYSAVSFFVFLLFSRPFALICCFVKPYVIQYIKIPDLGGTSVTLRTFFGNRDFYRNLTRLLIPLTLQQVITNFVSLLDNLMVGNLGTPAISAVAVVNQLIFILNLAIFGMLSGASIFGAQFFGKRDREGLRNTFRFKLIFTLALTVVFIIALSAFSDDLIMLFLSSESNSPEDTALALGLAENYLSVMLIGLIPYAIVQIYSGTLKDCGVTVPPMVASSAAVAVNMMFNYLLIFGKLGFPKLGVVGAAIATVMSRFVEMLYIIIYTHRRLERFDFLRGIYKSLCVPRDFMQRVFVTGAPLLANEVLWSLGTTFINLNYSSRGLDVIAAVQINQTVWQLFCVVMFAMGSAVSIILGQKLGTGDTDGAKADSVKLITFTLILHVGIGLLLVALSPLVPLLYNVTDDVRTLVSRLMIIAGASLPIHAFVHVSYFTIRSGGKTLITFLFDSVYTWCVPVVLSFILCRFTLLTVPMIYFIVQFSDIIKLSIALPMLKSGFWASCVVSDKSSDHI